MKSKYIVPCCLGWLVLAVSASPTPCRADDHITYSVPFSSESLASGFNPNVSTTFSYTPGRAGTEGSNNQNKSLDVEKYDINFTGLGWSFNHDTGIEAGLGAVQYRFPKASTIILPQGGIPNDTRSVYGSLALWHNVAPQWTVGTGIYGGDAGEDRLFSGLVVGATYRPSTNFRTYIRLAAARVGHTTYAGGFVGYEWEFAPRWRVEGNSLLRTVVHYGLRRNLDIYGGLVSDGGLFNVQKTPGNPSLRNTLLEYSQNDLQVGLDWKVTKGWNIGVSLGLALHQDFKYHQQGGAH